MKLKVILGAGLLAVMVALGGTAFAQACAGGCATQATACLHGARTSAVACRIDCRKNAAPADLGSCMRGCRDGFRQARATCNTDRTDCIGACDPTTAAGASVPCLGTCGQDLGSCTRGVAATMSTCVRDCRSADDRADCLRACVATSNDGDAGCKSAFVTCRENCGTPMPTTTTTLPTPPACHDSEAPTCGGSCPTVDQTCTAVSATRCACISGSTSGAFVK
jgi:hypothetical protein